VGKYFGHHGTGSCSSKAALQVKASLELRGNKVSRVEALRQRPCPMVPKQEEQMVMETRNSQLPRLPDISGGEAGLW